MLFAEIRPGKQIAVVLFSHNGVRLGESVTHIFGQNSHRSQLSSIRVLYLLSSVSLVDRSNLPMCIENDGAARAKPNREVFAFLRADLTLAIETFLEQIDKRSLARLGCAVVSVHVIMKACLVTLKLTSSLQPAPPFTEPYSLSILADAQRFVQDLRLP